MGVPPYQDITVIIAIITTIIAMAAWSKTASQNTGSGGTQASVAVSIQEVKILEEPLQIVVLYQVKPATNKWNNGIH